MHHQQSCSKPIDIRDDNAMHRMARLHSLAGNLIGWKDLDSKFLWASETAAVLGGFQGIDDFIGEGITEDNVRCRACEMYEQFYLEDQRVIQSCRPLRMLTYACCVDNTWHALLIQKYPLFRPDGRIFALGQYVQDITDAPLAIVNYRFLKAQSNVKGTAPSQFSCQLDDLLDEHALTLCQKEVIFYLLRGHSAKGIAQRMGKNVRTVQGYLNALRLQFGCDTKAELHEKLMALGYMQLLPSSCLAGV